MNPFTPDTSHISLFTWRSVLIGCLFSYQWAKYSCFFCISRNFSFLVDIVDDTLKLKRLMFPWRVLALIRAAVWWLADRLELAQAWAHRFRAAPRQAHAPLVLENSDLSSASTVGLSVCVRRGQGEPSSGFPLGRGPHSYNVGLLTSQQDTQHMRPLPSSSARMPATLP